MNTNCRFNIADVRSASRAVICHAIIQPKRRPFRVSVAGNTLGLAIAPHTFERGIGFQAKSSNDTENDIPSGGCRSKLSGAVASKARNFSFAQKDYRGKFSFEGRAAFKDKFGIDIATIDDFADAMSRSVVDPEDVSVEVVNRKGVDYVLNIRTAKALEKAGIKKEDRNINDLTKDKKANDRLDGQLSRNDMEGGDRSDNPVQKDTPNE